jgi:hypothetical protein
MAVARWYDRGLSPAMVRSLARSGELVRMRRGVYASKGAVDWAGADPVRAHVLRVLAARATVGRQAVASHHSAALLHRLDLLRSPPAGIVTLTLPPAKPWNRGRPADIHFHTADLPPDHVTRLYNLPLTSQARTVVDLARTLPFTDAVVLADSALSQEKTTKPELRNILDACQRWPGLKQARRVVEFADERAESPLESAARVVFDQFGLNPPELQATLRVSNRASNVAVRVDFLWRERKVIVEADGLVKYHERKDLIAQLERDRLLRDAGYKVVHFTWRELFETPEIVIARIRRALADKGAW